MRNIKGRMFDIVLSEELPILVCLLQNDEIWLVMLLCTVWKMLGYHRDKSVYMWLARIRVMVDYILMLECSMYKAFHLVHIVHYADYPQ